MASRLSGVDGCELVSVYELRPDDHVLVKPGETIPADGVVVERNARTGHWAVSGETLLAIADYSVIQIEGELPESLIPRVVSRSSDKVRVRVPADPKYLGEGRIKFISPVLDEIKRSDKRLRKTIITAHHPAGTHHA